MKLRTNFYSAFFIVVSLLLSFCKSDEENQVQEFKFPDAHDIIPGMASPVILNPDKTTVNMRSYFPLVAKIDSFATNRYLEAQFDSTNFQLKLKVLSDKLPNLSVLKSYIGGQEYAIILKKTNQVAYTFRFKPEGKNYEKVQMKGEMNAWNPAKTPFELKNGVWEATIRTEPGNYQYVFVLNGSKEIRDPENPDSVSNGMGGFNSIIKIGNTDKSKFPRLYTRSADENIFYIKTENKPDRIFVLYQNYLLPEDMFVKTAENQYRIIIPGDAKDRKRSHIRVYAYNTHGVSNNLLVPIERGQVLTNTENLSRSDFHAATLYNVFVDRFNNADTTNDRPVPDKEIRPKANYFGGDIAGIIEKIQDGYFESLGINTIWISPIVKNPEGAYGLYPKPRTKFSGYHGYWPVSFTLVDDRYGTEEELKKMVDLAHEKGMNVLLDFVANHVHEEHPFIKKHPEYKTQLHLPDGSLNTRRWDEHRLTTWFDVFLPTLDLEKPEVYQMLTDSAVYWIDHYNFDGFRHDATKHIPLVFWETLTYKLKKEVMIPKNRKLYQIGETYGSPQLISSYVGSGKLSAQFDFNMYDALVGALVGGNSFNRFAEVLKSSEKFYGSHHVMGNISGNQDRARFISYADGSLEFSEDAKLAGWTREITNKGESGYRQAKILHTVIAAIPGVPVIYYGDEIGLPGGNDPDNRRMMKFKDLNENQKSLLEATRKVFNFRRNSMALNYGDMHIIRADDDILLIERQYFGELVYLAVNKSDTNARINFPLPKFVKDVTFETLYNTQVKIESGNISLNLPPHSAEMIYRQN